MAYQLIESLVEDTFKKYLMGQLGNDSSSSSSSIDSSSSSSSENETDGYNYLVGLNNDDYKLPAIIIQCTQATIDAYSFNWLCQVEISVEHFYADATRQEHNNKTGEIRDLLVVDSNDLIAILNLDNNVLNAMQWTVTGVSRSINNKKWKSSLVGNLLCNALG